MQNSVNDRAKKCNRGASQSIIWKGDKAIKQMRQMSMIVLEVGTEGLRELNAESSFILDLLSLSTISHPLQCLHFCQNSFP
jgi:hypothetical protein